MPSLVNLVLFYCTSFFFSFKLLTSDVCKGAISYRAIKTSFAQSSLKKNSVSGIGDTNSEPCGFCPKELGWLESGREFRTALVTERRCRVLSPRGLTCHLLLPTAEMVWRSEPGPRRPLASILMRWHQRQPCEEAAGAL